MDSTILPFLLGSAARASSPLRLQNNVKIRRRLLWQNAAPTNILSKPARLRPNPTPSDGRHIAVHEIALVWLETRESAMSEAASRYLSLIATVVFSFTLVTTWAAVLGYGIFRLGAWALAY